jgi:hypothetical protein
MRYVANEPLFFKDSVIGRGGEYIDFRINPNLKGKPVFQAYNIATGEIYKTYVASPDSAKIMAQHSPSTSYFMADTTIGKYLLYYIQVKQSDNIKYRKGG